MSLRCCRPFDNTAIADLTAALAATMTTIDASDINTISATQTVSFHLFPDDNIKLTLYHYFEPGIQVCGPDDAAAVLHCV